MLRTLEFIHSLLYVSYEYVAYLCPSHSFIHSFRMFYSLLRSADVLWQAAKKDHWMLYEWNTQAGGTTLTDDDYSNPTEIQSAWKAGQMGLISLFLWWIMMRGENFDESRKVFRRTHCNILLVHNSPFTQPTLITIYLNLLSSRWFTAADLLRPSQISHNYDIPSLSPFTNKYSFVEDCSTKTPTGHGSISNFRNTSIIEASSTFSHQTASHSHRVGGWFVDSSKKLVQPKWD
jgi:hypothetical protein